MKENKNKLYVGDNLDIMHGMNSNSVDLIYLDPPFNSERKYLSPIGSPAEKKASAKGKVAGFDDIWVWNEDVDARLDLLLTTRPELFAVIEAIGDTHSSGMKAYLTFMTQRIIEMHRILKPTGSFYLHCDPHASHYLKIILDDVFGKDKFRNEIIWSYRTGGASKKQFSRKHDVILFYGDEKNRTFNTLKEKSYTKSKTRKPGIVNYGGGKAEFFEDEKGVYNFVLMRDVWDISYVGSTHPERTGYETQKPLELLERIITASSNEGDMVMDPFCGCATTCVAAQNLHRNWIGIDISDVAADLVVDRLVLDEDGDAAQFKLKSPKELFDEIHHPPTRTDIETIKLTPANKTKIRHELFGLQKGYCNGCGKEKGFEDFHIDHIHPKSRGGADAMENFQLLCGNCNNIKGNRPMEYLQQRIKARNAMRERF